MQRDLSSFAGALLDRAGPPPHGIYPATRFAIHRNNVLAGLTKLLEARFPVVRRLVGDNFFAAMAADFIRAAPPQSPILLEYGEALPAFLAGFAPVRDLGYLPDVAQLEWSLHAATQGADATPLDAATLQQVPPELVPDLRLILHPTLMLLASRYPIVSIWRANQPDAAAQIVSADMPGEAALIVRPHLVPLINIVPDAVMPFVSGLGAGLALGAAAARATDPAFDLTAALVLLLKSGAIIGFTMESDPGAFPS